MHEEDCRLPSLDWLVKTCQTMPSSLSPVKATSPLTSFRPRSTSEPTTSSAVDYSNVPQKPPYSYSQLIVEAMKHFGGQKVLLTDIYTYIRDQYAWYRLCDPSWQNSIRHNLSLNKQFIKIPRLLGDKGKGSYWRLDINANNNGVSKPRKPTNREKKGSSKRRTISATETPQVNPAVLSFLKENSETLCGQSSSSSSSRSTPQIMEIGVDDRQTADDKFSDSPSCGFSAYTDDFSTDYDANFQFASFFTDVEYNAEMTMIPDSNYQEVDPALNNSKTWLPLENGLQYSYESEMCLNRDICSALVPEQEAHPWQDKDLRITDDSLLFDSGLR